MIFAKLSDFHSLNFWNSKFTISILDREQMMPIRAVLCRVISFQTRLYLLNECSLSKFIMYAHAFGYIFYGPPISIRRPLHLQAVIELLETNCHASLVCTPSRDFPRLQDANSVNAHFRVPYSLQYRYSTDIKIEEKKREKRCEIVHN